MSKLTPSLLRVLLVPCSGYGLAVRMSGEAGQQRPHFEFRQRVEEVRVHTVVDTVMTGTT